MNGSFQQKRKHFRPNWRRVPGLQRGIGRHIMSSPSISDSRGIETALDVGSIEAQKYLVCQKL